MDEDIPATIFLRLDRRPALCGRISRDVSFFMRDRGTVGERMAKRDTVD